MAEKEQKDARTLEMRVAELEDKLQQMHITEEEMAAYHKVASAMGGGAAASADLSAKVPQPCVVQQCTTCVVQPQCIQDCIKPCVIQQCTHCVVHPNCIQDCIKPCVISSCKPCVVHPHCIQDCIKHCVVSACKQCVAQCVQACIKDSTPDASFDTFGS